MLIYKGYTYYKKHEVISLLNLHKSTSAKYLTHTYNIIIACIQNDKDNTYKLKLNTSLYDYFIQMLQKHLEQQYKSFLCE